MMPSASCGWYGQCAAASVGEGRNRCNPAPVRRNVLDVSYGIGDDFRAVRAIPVHVRKIMRVGLRSRNRISPFGPKCGESPTEVETNCAGALWSMQTSQICTVCPLCAEKTTSRPSGEMSYSRIEKPDTTLALFSDSRSARQSSVAPPGDSRLR